MSVYVALQSETS